MLNDCCVLDIAEIKHHTGCGQVGNEPQIKFSKLHGENVCKSQETASDLHACICFLFSVPRDEMNAEYILGTCHWPAHF